MSDEGGATLPELACPPTFQADNDNRQQKHAITTLCRLMFERAAGESLTLK